MNRSLTNTQTGLSCSGEFRGRALPQSGPVYGSITSSRSSSFGVCEDGSCCPASGVRFAESLSRQEEAYISGKPGGYTPTGRLISRCDSGRPSCSPSVGHRLGTQRVITVGKVDVENLQLQDTITCRWMSCRPPSIRQECSPRHPYRQCIR